MTSYHPDFTEVYQEKDLSPVPITEAMLLLEKAINGNVDRGNFSKEEALGLRSFHRRSLSESHRGRQLIFQEPAIWMFFWRSDSSTNEFDHLGGSDNHYTVEEAGTRVALPHDAIVHVTSQIQIDSYKFSGNDQSGVHAGGSPFTLFPATNNADSQIMSAGEIPAIKLTFTLWYAFPTLTPAKAQLDSASLIFPLYENSALDPTDALNKLRTGGTVNLSGIHENVLGEAYKRTGLPVDYWVSVTATFVRDGTHTLSNDEVVYIAVRSLSRNINATVYHAADVIAATSGIAAP